MAPFIILLSLLSVAASDLVEVTVKTGDDATLPCRADGSSIRAVEWRRPGLEPGVIIFYRDEQGERVNPSFRGRVELVNVDLKDGDVSLTLKNVSRHDAGTYECRVASGGSSRKKRNIIDSEPIRIIRLQVFDADQFVVVDPGDDAILPCWAALSSVRFVVWSRPDLEPDTVLRNVGGTENTNVQNPSFKDRVELVHRNLKDRNVSLILNNVNINDTGTYRCQVTTHSPNIKIITYIHLQVTGPEDKNPLLVANMSPGQQVLDIPGS